MDINDIRRNNRSLEMAKVLFQKRHLSSSLDKVHIKIDHLIWLHSNYVRWTTIISEVYQIVVYLTLRFTC